MTNPKGQFEEKTTTRRGLSIFLIVASVLVMGILLLFTALLVVSPGKMASIKAQNGKAIKGSISEKVFVEIGGVKQGMFIRGIDTTNPVLLFVHGGPSFSEYFLVEKYPTGIEENFTVCYWEERGGGLSVSPDIPPESMTLEQLAMDAIEVTNYLRKRFSKDKIFMMAHSGGTTFAIAAAAREPQLYHAYIGMAQITKQAESEKIAYKYMVERYKKSGNHKALKELEKFPVLTSDTSILPFHNSLIRDQSMHELGIGTMRNMKSVLFDVFIPVWVCRAYTLKEKANIWIAKFSTLPKTTLKKQICATDIPTQIPKIDIPVYFFSGKYDMTVNIDLSRAYLDKLEAPVKGFYTFENSAHSPIFEETAKFKDIMTKDVINLTVNLADGKTVSTSEN